MDIIKRALISVSDKTGIVDFAKFLVSKNIEIISTGGTAKTLKDAGIPVVLVSDLTGFPEILDGRVKTLHPKIHGGILARRDVKRHRADIEKHDIQYIDMVVVNLYPFEDTVKDGASETQCIENIDIGGPCLIRAAAKNHNDVTVVVDSNDYKNIEENIEKNCGNTDIKFRRFLAAKAFTTTSRYDIIIGRWISRTYKTAIPEHILLNADRKQKLRYGENPHQQASFYIDPTCNCGIGRAEQIQGKELSYNNIMDANAALELISEFKQPVATIIKHTNPCGIAIGNTISEAYKKALSCDSVSAFGGIIGLNKTLDVETAKLIAQQFVEVVLAPSIDDDAKEILSKKKSLRILLLSNISKPKGCTGGERNIRHVVGGFLIQEMDKKPLEELEVVTKTEPTDEQNIDMTFAFKVAKHVKSNAIVIAKNGQTIGIGAGQTSRVDSVRLAIQKAKNAGFSTEGAVLASDAFFPFHDSVMLASEAKITALIQPGGSIRDDEVIKVADDKNITMVFTGQRHFRH